MPAWPRACTSKLGAMHWSAPLAGRCTRRANPAAKDLCRQTKRSDQGWLT